MALNLEPGSRARADLDHIMSHYYLSVFALEREPGTRVSGKSVRHHPGLQPLIKYGGTTPTPQLRVLLRSVQ